MGSIVYKIDKERGVIYKIMEGEISNKTLFDAEVAQFQNPEFPDSPKVLVNVMSANFPELTPQDYLRFVSIYKERPEKVAGTRVALVAMGEFQKGRQYEAAVRSMGVNVIVFTNVPVACSWLGISATDASECLAKLRESLPAE